MLNKLNIFIGPQSGGKSTITKIACFCTWVEKRSALLSTNQELLSKEGAFAKELVRFHKLNGYLQNNNYIYYESDILQLEYHHSKKIPVFNGRIVLRIKKGKYLMCHPNVILSQQFQIG